jgi:DNA helicase-2/ATP-dependent DNA helicase PcrA
MTRARELLYLTNVVVRRLWGNVNYQEPARFFAEIPDELVDFRDLSQGQQASRFRPGSSRGFGFRETSGVNYETPVMIKGRSDDGFSQLTPDDEIAGRKLQHPEYGSGTIVFAEGSGEATKVTVEFGAGKGRRKFLLRFVKDYIR